MGCKCWGELNGFSVQDFDRETKLSLCQRGTFNLTKSTGCSERIAFSLIQLLQHSVRLYHKITINSWPFFCQKNSSKFSIWILHESTVCECMNLLKVAAGWLIENCDLLNDWAWLHFANRMHFFHENYPSENFLLKGLGSCPEIIKVVQRDIRSLSAKEPLLTNFCGGVYSVFDI